ncbi:PTS fructose transporter subunit IIABC [Spiroplasma endosymbiont of Aspidapion aeneum]|uniref:PTS fructose transporter subunit IIABC n=1 Tax=Spiroplasma endosymbiont of Aspidapion aeneum TaxID=3066276 RepID=UPI00313EBA44
MEKGIIKKDYIFIDKSILSKEKIFEFISNICIENNIVENRDALIKAFLDRENLEPTFTGDGFAIPHARTSGINKPAIFFMRLKTPVKWFEDNKVKCLIALIIPEKKADYLDILSKVATKLLDKNIVEKLNTEKSIDKIYSILAEDVELKKSHIGNKDNISIVGVTACATGVAHTYMAREAIISACEKLNWNCSIETQGQKGQEFNLTTKEIDDADGVILATDIAIDMERFVGKKILKLGTKETINNPIDSVRNVISKGQVFNQGLGSNSIFEVNQKKAWIGHIMSGVSFMIPFIVFAGIIFAVVTGIGKLVYGPWLNYSDGKLDGMVYIQENIHIQSSWSLQYLTHTPSLKDNGLYTARIEGFGIAFFYLLNNFANVGFLVMIPIMGAYIANSIAGRAAICPAFVLTFLGVTPSYWMSYGAFYDMKANFPSNGGGIFAALLFGFVVGYTIKIINTRIRINKYIQPIMPIIIIPVFVSLIYGIITILLLGNIFGISIGYVNKGLQKMEESNIGMPILGLILGMLAGVDMGGPINKIASFGATALIFTDGGKAMGTAAAAFAVAPMGCGIATFIFRNRFKKDKPIAVNAIILGFMGISEGAIPFAVKYTWAVICANIIGSGVAGMLAGLFHVSGWVGAWGGPIIAFFGGVTTWTMGYIGILYYFIAIAAGIAVQIVLFRFFVKIQDKKSDLNIENDEKQVEQITNKVNKTEEVTS